MKHYVIFPGILSDEGKRDLMEFLDNCEVINEDWLVGLKDAVDSRNDQTYSFSACEVNFPSAFWPDFVEQFREHYNYGVNLVDLSPYSPDCYLVEEVSK